MWSNKGYTVDIIYEVNKIMKLIDKGPKKGCHFESYT